MHVYGAQVSDPKHVRVFLGTILTVVSIAFGRLRALIAVGNLEGAEQTAAAIVAQDPTVYWACMLVCINVSMHVYGCMHVCTHARV